jgi:hypothetical protein
VNPRSRAALRSGFFAGFMFCVPKTLLVVSASRVRKIMRSARARGRGRRMSLPASAGRWRPLARMAPMCDERCGMCPACGGARTHPPRESCVDLLLCALGEPDELRRERVRWLVRGTRDALNTQEQRAYIVQACDNRSAAMRRRYASVTLNTVLPQNVAANAPKPRRRFAMRSAHPQKKNLTSAAAELACDRPLRRIPSAWWYPVSCNSHGWRRAEGDGSGAW